MNKVIAIGGEPATGKTTLMFELIKLADDWEIVKPKKLLDAMYSKKQNLYILGKYANDGNVFQGTDRLSMAVQPDAEPRLLQQDSTPVQAATHCLERTEWRGPHSHTAVERKKRNLLFCECYPSKVQRD